MNYYYFGRKTKISAHDITYGPVDHTLDEATVFFHAAKLAREGWVGVSNAYCHLKRIDRDDWVVVLAKNLGMTMADFHIPGESWPARHWKDQYLRCYSKAKLIVHPQIYDAIKRMNNY